MKHQPNDLTNLLRRPVETATHSGHIKIQWGQKIQCKKFNGVRLS